jgi:hypothetical protein
MVVAYQTEEEKGERGFLSAASRRPMSFFHSPFFSRFPLPSKAPSGLALGVVVW